jgi:hypothetical protein
MRQRALFRGAIYEHVDGTANARIDVDHEDLFFVAEKNRHSGVRGNERLDLDLDHILAHGRKVSAHDTMSNHVTTPGACQVQTRQRHVALGPSSNPSLFLFA